jgi:hypothetical protein
MHTNNPSYFNHSLKGKVFGDGKPCLVLETVCWMDPWGIIEGVKIPTRDNTKLSLCIYHAYQSSFRMRNEIKMEMADTSDAEHKWNAVWSTKWPV